MKKILLIVLTLISISVNAQDSQIERNYYGTYQYYDLYAINSNSSPLDTISINSGNVTINYQHDKNQCEIIMNVTTNNGDKSVELSQTFYNAELYLREYEDGDKMIIVFNKEMCVFKGVQKPDRSMFILLPNAYVFGL